VNDPSLDRIAITATFSNLPEETREILRKVKAGRAERRKSARDDLAVPPLPIEKPHRALASTARELLKAKRDEYGAVSATEAGMCGVRVHVDHAHRVIAFLHALATTLEEDGLELRPNGTRMEIAVGPDKVAFTVTEHARREKHIPTEEEQGLYDRQQAKRQRAADRQDWDLYMSLPYQKPWPEYDTVYTGRLIFQIEGWPRGVRKTWADGKTQSIESMLEAITSGLKIILAQEKTERERREEEGRERAELARRHDLAKKRREREERRIAYLRELVQLQREAGDIKRWLASLPDGVMADSLTELGRMVLWARERLGDLEGRTTVKAALVQVQGMALFPEVDDLHDPLGDPPAQRNY
jgi:hypothetical protein